MKREYTGRETDRSTEGHGITGGARNLHQPELEREPTAGA